MNICTGSGILSGMDISALNTTNDIEKLRAMALAMVQKLMSENAADKAEQERELQAQKSAHPASGRNAETGSSTALR